MNNFVATISTAVSATTITTLGCIAVAEKFIAAAISVGTAVTVMMFGSTAFASEVHYLISAQGHTRIGSIHGLETLLEPAIKATLGVDVNLTGNDMVRVVEVGSGCRIHETTRANKAYWSYYDGKLYLVVKPKGFFGSNNWVGVEVTCPKP